MCMLRCETNIEDTDGHSIRAMFASSFWRTFISNDEQCHVDLNVKTMKCSPHFFLHFEPHPAPGNVIHVHRLGGCQGKAPGVREGKCQNTSQDSTILHGAGKHIIFTYVYTTKSICTYEMYMRCM